MTTKTEEWYDCYKKGWQGVLTDSSFKHPAKFGYGLIHRMLEHAMELGVLRRGGLVVDPFGGVGCGGVICAYHHIRWVGCELEKQFHDMAIENFKLHRLRWQRMGYPVPVILNGDSRRLSSILHDRSADMIVSSPPFGQASKGGGIADEGFLDMKTGKRTPPSNAYQRRQQGESPGQLASMKEGDVDAVISSPPFEGVVAFQDKSFRNKKGKMFNKTQAIDGTYGSSSKEQLGNQKGESFWEAARDIVRQCHEILKPKGLCIWVCKDYIKKGARVPFSDNWAKLCASCGFRLRCRHKAMVKKQWKTGVLFGDDTKKKERKSFFRKLAERNGSPEINWEDIICMEKV